jgi:hypothetical protein
VKIAEVIDLRDSSLTGSSRKYGWKRLADVDCETGTNVVDSYLLH